MSTRLPIAAPILIAPVPSRDLFAEDGDGDGDDDAPSAELDKMLLLFEGGDEVDGEPLDERDKVDGGRSKKTVVVTGML